MSLVESRIRPAAKREIPEIEAVSVAAYAEYRDEVPAPMFDAYITDLRRLGDCWHEVEVLVAEVGGHIAGCVLFYADAGKEALGWPQGWSGFRKLAVDPRMRGHGLGRRLTSSCIAAARKRGAPALGIHVVSFKQAVRRLYEEMGFYRCPEFDLSASDMGLGNGSDGIKIIAYRLDLATA